MPPNPKQQLQTAADRALGASATSEGRLAFLQRYLRPEGKPWSLAGHEFLRAIIEDPADCVVGEKAAQLGLSTVMIGGMLKDCLDGYKAGYFLDTKAAMKEFVQARVDPLIDANTELVKLVIERKFEPDRPRRRGKGGADNIRLKQIGPQGLAYFLGVNNRGDVKSRALDAVYLDEVAELDPDLVAFVDDRMLHSPLRKRREISQPRIPGMDIDESFQRSDQKYWKHRCPRCRTWTALELAFPECLVQVRGEWRIACPKCHARLIESPSGSAGVSPASAPQAPPSVRAEWVAMYPGRKISGYHLTQLYGPFVTPAQIAERWALAQTHYRHMANFMISWLGLPFAGDNQPLTEELCKQRTGDWGMTQSGQGHLPPGLAYAGIDVGAEKHLFIYRLGADGWMRTVWMERTRDWELLEKRLRDHDVLFFVIDALPETSKAKDLCRALAYPDGRPRGAIVYTSSQTTSFTIEDEATAPVQAIKTNRTTMIDDFAEEVKAGRFWLPTQRLAETAIAIQHFSRLVKDKDDKTGVARYRRNVENHYGLAAAHSVLARILMPAIVPPPAGHFEPGAYHTGNIGLPDHRRTEPNQSIFPTRW